MVVSVVAISATPSARLAGLAPRQVAALPRAAGLRGAAAGAARRDAFVSRAAAAAVAAGSQGGRTAITAAALKGAADGVQGLPQGHRKLYRVQYGC